jgi:hypothetical protein
MSLEESDLGGGALCQLLLGLSFDLFSIEGFL